ncbi:exopolyphosphatase [Microtetraspora sp. NBRC 13810]|uniref:Ppx/GppA phosphatase family protein n=1 Tax=Microtetraspora sp. NBRC 13810 TaxID=3030990 RepID=UPI0024A34682|nr:Ppx/GppA family phosphatase [Microtetraspora sp. NBRC 13810]GLW09177.1 exopolyphosphatase [Microtetraspora sp. NBRC 13810]
MQQAGVLDVGCHSALLTVVRPAQAATGLETVLSRKVRLRLHQMLAPDGRLRERGVRSVQRAVVEAMEAGPDPRPEVFAFATSVIRDAPNRNEVISRVARATGTRLRVLPGREEARLAYVAARHWAGDHGPLLVLDIGGGTVEIASGTGGQPDTVLSLPFGARTVTRQWLPGGTVSSKRHLSGLRRHLREALGELPGLPTARPGTRVLASSKTFTQLARLSAGRGASPRKARELTLTGLRASLALLARTDIRRRGDLPGISGHRAEQSLAGALVAEALMDACETPSVEICPWSTREGLLLERLSVTGTAARRHRLTV